MPRAKTQPKPKLPIPGETYDPLEVARWTPAGFAMLANPDFQIPPHIDLINRRLMAVARGEVKRLMINLPPRNGKSWMVNWYFPCWYLGWNPDKRVMLTAYGSTFAKDWGRKVRETLKAYGPRVWGVRPRKDIGTADSWEMEQHSGGMKTAGVGGDVTGRGGHLVIIDDPVKSGEEAVSETYQQRTWEWYTSTLIPRQEPNAAIILVMTRWHENDLAGKIEAQARQEGDEWEVLSIPALAEEGDLLGREVGDILWPERFSREWLLGQRAEMGEFWWCTPGETPILMSDWKTKPISEVRSGDEIVGFQQGGGIKGGTKLRLQVARVKRVFSRRAIVHNLVMESGRVVRCTKEHKWFKGRGPADRRPMYGPAKVGSRLHYFCPPQGTATPEERAEWSYLAGIVDGEGHITRSTITITQAIPRNQPVFDRIKLCLTRLGIQYTELPVQKGERPKWSDRARLWIRNQAEVARGLLRFAECGKHERLKAVLLGGSGRCAREIDRVTRIDPGSEEEVVYALETETGNYIAWGYASSNSAEYQQHPVPPEGAVFPTGCFQEWTVLPAYFDSVILSMDCSFTDKISSSYAVIQAWGTRDANLYLLDQWRDRVRYSAARDALRRMAAKHPLATAKLIEETAGGFAILDDLKHEIGGLIPIKVAGKGGGKLGRARAVEPLIQARNVWVPERASCPWVDGFLTECQAFPVGRHDDQVDAMTMALGWLRKGTRALSAKPSVWLEAMADLEQEPWWEMGED